MKRLDRAMYGIFLLVLLADVARAHASAPSGDAGLILSAASQFQAGPSEGAILALRRSDGYSSPIATIECFARTFSGWPRNFLNLAAPAPPCHEAFAADAAALLPAESQSAPPSPAIFEHIGSPAP